MMFGWGNAEGNKVRLTIEWADSKKKKKEEDAWVVRRGFGSSCEWPETQEKIIRHASWPSWSTGGTAQDEGKSSDRHEEEEERDILLRRGRSQ